MQKQLDEILQRRMDRKEFLKNMAMGVAVITGAAGVIKVLKPEAAKQQNGQQQVAAGYGASVYGGAPAATQTSVPKS